MEATIELPDAESLPDGTEQIRGPPTVSYEDISKSKMHLHEHRIESLHIGVLNEM